MRIGDDVSMPLCNEKLEVPEAAEDSSEVPWLCTIKA